MTAYFRQVLMCCGLLTLMACGNESAPASDEPAGATVAKVEGSVLYRERMMLPPGAVLEVQLQDISRADAMATVMATMTAPATGAPPYAFSLEYDPNSIDPRMRYGLRATISLEDQLLFTTTEHIDPFAGNPLEVVVHRVAEPVRHNPGQ